MGQNRGSMTNELPANTSAPRHRRHRPSVGVKSQELGRDNALTTGAWPRGRSTRTAYPVAANSAARATAQASSSGSGRPTLDRLRGSGSR